MVVIDQSSTRWEVNSLLMPSFRCSNLKPLNPERVWLWLMMGRNFLVLVPCFLISQHLKPAFVFELKPLQKSRMQSKEQELPFCDLRGPGTKNTRDHQRPNKIPQSGRELQTKGSKNRLQYIHDANIMALHSYQQEKGRWLHKWYQLENCPETYKVEFLFHTFALKQIPDGAKI